MHVKNTPFVSIFLGVNVFVAKKPEKRLIFQRSILKNSYYM